MSKIGMRKYNAYMWALVALLTGLLIMVKLNSVEMYKMFVQAVVGVVGLYMGGNAVKPFFSSSSITIGKKGQGIE